MTYQIVNNGSTQYAVHWETIERMNRSFRLAEATLNSARTVAMDESTWYNPFSWSLPKIYNVEVDWERVREEAASFNAQDMMSYAALAGRSMPDVGYEMLFRIERTHQYKKRYREMVTTAGADSQKNIEASVDNYDGLINGAKFIRDTSFDVVGVGATIMTGGAAATLTMGAHATLKAGAKYQDTGSVGLAGAQFGGSLLFGAFKIRPQLGAAKLSKSGEYVLILCQGAFETGMSLAAGDSFATAAKKGTLKIIGDGGAKFVLNTEVAKNLISKMPIPGNMVIDVSGNTSALVGKVVEKLAANITGKIAGPAVVNQLGGQGTAGNGAGGTRRLVDDALVADEMLLKLAIVDMKKGVGRGW
jgi:hypothetical protein